MLNFVHVRPLFHVVRHGSRTYPETFFFCPTKTSYRFPTKRFSKYHVQSVHSDTNSTLAKNPQDNKNTNNIITAAEETLRKVSKSFDICDAHVNKLLRLTDLVLETNRVQNLTAIRSREDIIIKHILDALVLLPLLEEGKNEIQRVIDVGTGAGFPGFVLAITRPNIHVTLLDSVRKKTTFHETVIKELQLCNVTSVWSRAEDAATSTSIHRETYCACVARSVARMPILAELTLPFVRVKGILIAQKMLDEQQEEIEDAKTAFHLLGAKLEKVIHGWRDDFGPGASIIDDNEVQKTKSLVVVRKTQNTKFKYPRKAGIPSKSPLR